MGVKFSLLDQALDYAGQKEMAQAIYEEAVQTGILKPWKTSKDSNGHPIRALDLHQFSGALSRAVIRSHLESLLARPQTSLDELVIVVGKGLHSIGGPILGDTVKTLLQEEYGITALVDKANAGRLIVGKQVLESLVESRGWG